MTQQSENISIEEQIKQAYFWAAYEDEQPALMLDGTVCQPWQVREWGGFSLRGLMEKHFEEAFALSEPWVHDPSVNVRRGALIGCKLTKKSATPERVHQVLERISHFMSDENDYIKKNCGPFVVNELGSLQPEIVLNWLKIQAQIPNVHVRANVAKAFTQAFGKRYPQEAMSVLELLRDDPERRVQSAIISALKNLNKNGAVSSENIRQRFPKQAEKVL
ncbi:MAG: HEAT repeat domain-containing protein [Candidatus Melainabacteria bacterium]|nr:HEAT repeat domain-containing protein [Candidatus Melainabacteria bacterium]